MKKVGQGKSVPKYFKYSSDMNSQKLSEDEIFEILNECKNA